MTRASGSDDIGALKGPDQTGPEEGHRTVVFSDLAGSTKLGESLDPETLRTILGHYFDEMRAVFVAEGGVIEKIIGDAIVAVFTPEGDDLEESALRAVKAVAGTQTSLAVLNQFLEDRWGVRLVVRTGVATGRLIVERLAGGHSVLGGSVMAVAESLESASPHFEVLVDGRTRALTEAHAEFEDMGEIDVKGGGGTVPSFRLESVDEDVGGARGPVEEKFSCESCGEDVPGGATHCPSCGAFTGRVVDTRRTVTAVFAAAKPVPNEGTEVTEDAESAVLSHFFEAVRSALEAHGATVETFIGDAIMAVFGLPVRHEDDALRAVRAADDVRRRLPAISDEVSEQYGFTVVCPIGVNTGEVVAGDASLGQRLVTGDTVNVAARLEQAAKSGEVLLGALTEQLVRGHVDVEAVEPLTLKGKSEPVPAFRLEGIRAEGSGPTLQLPMVGRDAEMGTLREAFRQSAATSATVTVIGEAGVGKSRLLAEFLDESAVPTVRGRCLPYGDGITFWPVAEIVREVADIRDDDGPQEAIAKLAAAAGEADVVDRLASLAGFTDATFATSELFWATRQLLEGHAGGEPMIVVFEDMHWAEGTFLDLIRYLDDALQDVPILIVCAARRALLDREPEWGTGEREALIVLEPLPPEAAEEIVVNMLGGAGLGEATTARIVQVADGNPLFVEQLLSMLIDGGQLVREGDKWVPASNLESIALPPSIHALLAARIDGLEPPDKAILEPASVVGKVFAQDAVRHLLGQANVTPELVERLSGLTARQILDEAAAADDVGRMLRFHHALLRDAAYQGLLKESRARLHEAFVQWADVVNEASGRGLEFEEILGYHLEQCFLYRRELGPLDDHVVAIGEDGSRRLGSAGRRAYARGDMPAAANLLTRATALLGERHPARYDLLLGSAEARFETGAFDEARSSISAAQELAEELDDAPGAAVAELEAIRFALFAGEVESTDEARGRVQALQELLEAAAHHAGLARGYRILASIAVFGEDFGAAEAAALDMVGEATLAGDSVLEMRTLMNLASLAPVGPTPVPEAIERCESVLDRVSGDRRSTANVQRALAQLHAMQGEPEEARRLYRTARATLEELGWRLDAALVAIDSGPIELLAGDWEAAVAELVWGADALTTLGDSYFLPTIEAYLAEALYRAGDLEGAAEAAERSKNTAEEDDIAPQVLWRAARAKLEAGAGNAEEALRLAREAVEISETSDGPTLRADALLSLGEVAAMTGDADAAAAAFAGARKAYDLKGCTAGVARVDALAGAGAGSPG